MLLGPLSCVQISHSRIANCPVPALILHLCKSQPTQLSLSWAALPVIYQCNPQGPRSFPGARETAAPFTSIAFSKCVHGHPAACLYEWGLAHKGIESHPLPPLCSALTGAEGMSRVSRQAPVRRGPKHTQALNSFLLFFLPWSVHLAEF